MYEFEQEALDKGYTTIAGCDEVGRGPLAGPLVAAAVVLDPNVFIEGLNDSKRLSEKHRNVLAEAIKAKAKAYSIVHVSAREVDAYNVYKASQIAMKKAVETLRDCDYVLSDALPLPGLRMPVESIVKGDAKSASIAAASILAKVNRDAFMVELSKRYPDYGFDAHKGYPTKAHLEALSIYGVMDEHRITYKPVKTLLMKQQSLDMEES